MNLLQTYTCLCIDNRCVDKRKRYAFYKMTMHSPHSQIKLIRQLYKLGSGFGKFKKDSNHMILYIRVRKSYFQISDFNTYCSVTYVIYNHNIINMYVLSYHISIRIIFGVSITILSMKKIILCIFYDAFCIHCKMAYR